MAFYKISLCVVEKIHFFETRFIFVLFVTKRRKHTSCKRTFFLHLEIRFGKNIGDEDKERRKV